jgi:uncharacterized repeat protein (TIGR01451 family)
MKIRSLVVAVAVLCLLTIPTLAQEEPPTGADLRVTKTGPEVAAAGADVSYDVTVTNDGPQEGFSVELSDPIPPGMTFVSATQDSGPSFVCSTPAVGATGTVTCSIASLAVGASADFTFVFQIDADTPPGTSFANIATATVAEISDPNEENNSAVAVTTTPYPPAGDLGITKTGPAFSGPDTNITYTITLVNGGPDAAENVTLTDVLSGSVEFVSAMQNSGPDLSCTLPPVNSSDSLTCTAASFPAGATAVFTLVVHIPSSVQQGTDLQNTFLVQSSNDPNDENNSGTIVTVVATVDASIDKSGPSTVTAGDNVPYTITVSNSGPAPAYGVAFTDVLPAGSTFVSFVQNSGPAASCVQATGTVQCSIGELPPGQSAQFTLVVRAGDTTGLVNDITLTTESFDTNSANDSDSVATTVTPSADLTAGKSGPASVMVENNVTYAVTVTNNGPSTASNVSVTDNAPAGTTFVSATQTSGPAFSCVGTVCTRATLAPLASATFDFTYAVPLGASGSVTNTATVASTTADPVPGNNTATAITPIVPASADLAVTKTGPATIAGGTNVTFTVTLTNNGPSTASNVSVTDDAPAGTAFVSVIQTGGPVFNCVATVCTRTTLAPLAPATFDFTYAVPLGATGSVTNIATVASTTADPVPGNNTATANAPIDSADLAVTKTGPATVVAGTNVSFTVTLTNNGPSTATGVTLADVVPSNAALVSVTQDSGPAFDCAVATCTRTSLAALASAAFTFTFAVPVDTAGSVVNTVNVSSSTPDPAPQNNTSTATAAITPAPADVSVSKTADTAEVYVSRTVVYTIVALNNGPGTATNVVVTDDLPAGATLQSAPGCTGTTTLTCNVGTLAAGASATFTVTATMPATSGVATNTVSVTSSSTDGDSANDRATAAVTVSVVPAPIPTLSPLAMALLALALCGLVYLRTS